MARSTVVQKKGLTLPGNILWGLPLTSTASVSRLLCAVPLPPAVAARAQSEFDVQLSQDRQLTVPEIVVALGADARLRALLVSSRIKLLAADIDALPDHVDLIATCSVGFGHIDVAAATNRGIAVTNTPDVLTEATADMALLLMIGACRHARQYGAILDQGWRRHFGLGDELGQNFSGKTLGIVGMGRIGRAVAQRARGFGVRVLYQNRNRLPPELEAGATYFEHLRDMLPQSQILSLHAPAGPGMDGLINADTLALLPKGAVFVNTARGSLVVEEDLIAALKSCYLAAAGLDVFRREPEYNLDLQALPNVFLTPHMGSATVETRDAMGHRSLDNVAAVFRGIGPPDQVGV
jgi:lactate dehydrogenase-like 2-hydroxyacid dehydrogenase